MLEQIKLALRITTDALDDEILDNIEAAKAELIRAGVDERVVFCEGPLVTQAVRAYCLSRLANDQDIAKRFEESFKYQEDCLRKSIVR